MLGTLLPAVTRGVGAQAPTATPVPTRTPPPTITPSPSPTPAVPDLVVTKTDAPDPVITGAVLTYAVTVANQGKGAAAATLLIDDLPVGVSMYSLGAGCFLAGEASSTVVCQVPPLAGGGRIGFVILVTVTAAAGTAITNSALVDPWNSVFELDEGNNSASTTTIVAAGTPATATPTPRVAPPPPAPSLPPPTAISARTVPPVGGAPTVPTATPSPTTPPLPQEEQWLRVLSDMPVYSLAGTPLWVALAGEWYKVARVEPEWALVIWEGDPPTNLVWIALGPTVQIQTLSRRKPTPPPESWLLVVSPTQTYTPDGAPRRIAARGERYRVLVQEGGWAFAIYEADPPAQPVWIEVDTRVQLAPSSAP